MSKYIDAEWLMKYFKRGKDYKGEYVLDDLKYDAPSIEVVRCGECKWFNEKYGSCHAYHWDLNQGLEYAEVDADDFCSYGERSEL